MRLGSVSLRRAGEVSEALLPSRHLDLLRGIPMGSGRGDRKGR